MSNFTLQLTLAQSYNRKTELTLLSSGGSGDIIIGGNVTYTLTNGYFDLGNRHIVIKDNGTLIIKNATVKSSLRGREELISAYDNAHIIIINTTFTDFANMRFHDSGVMVKIINSKSLRDFQAKKAGWRYYYNSIGIGWGGPSVTIVNSTYGWVAVWGKGAKVHIINSSFAGGYITGNSSIFLISSIFRYYELTFGSTWILLGPINLTLSLSNGLIKYWNIYKNSMISAKPFNLTIINSAILNWGSVYIGIHRPM